MWFLKIFSKNTINFVKLKIDIAVFFDQFSIRSFNFASSTLFIRTILLFIAQQYMFSPIILRLSVSRKQTTKWNPSLGVLATAIPLLDCKVNRVIKWWQPWHDRYINSLIFRVFYNIIIKEIKSPENDPRLTLFQRIS